MQTSVNADERAALMAAQRQSRSVRHWRRYQAVLLRAEGMPVKQVAQSFGCTETRVCNWTAAYRTKGVDGVGEGLHLGAVRRLDAAGEAVLNALPQGNAPQAHGYRATGWTVPLLQTELAMGGWRTSLHTIRRTLHRLGWRWKRPKYVLGRPDPAYTEKKAVAEQATAMLAAGGEVWFGDETTLRAFPPLRAAWAKRGKQAVVVVSRES
jgi:transposase